MSTYHDMEKHPLLGKTGDAEAASRIGRFVRLSNMRRLDCAPCLPTRYVLALMACLGFVNVYMLRVNLSVALVQMVRSTATVTNRSARVFDWSSAEQGWVLSSFFIGYLFFQLPGGLLAQRVGGKWLFGVGILATSIFTLLTPVAAYFNVWALVAVRVLEGLFEGITFPVMQTMLSKWAPPNERSKMLSVTFCGVNIGMIVGFTFSGLLCQYGFDGGWPSVFYVFGGLGIVWFLLWAYLAHDSPAKHPRISREERDYIELSIGEVKSEIRPPVPWMEIFTSVPLLANVVGMFTFSWGAYVAMSCIPLYFNQALRLKLGDSIVMNGIYTAIPYFLFTFLQLSGGIGSDFAIEHGISNTIVRKACYAFGQIPSALFLLLCGYFGNSLATGVIFMTLSVGVTGLTPLGINPNILDMSPRYAGVTMAITNTLGTISGILGPIVVEAIAKEPQYIPGSQAYTTAYKDEWREVFVIGAEILVFGTLVILILGSSRQQPWNEGPAWFRERKSLNTDE